MRKAAPPPTKPKLRAKTQKGKQKAKGVSAAARAARAVRMAGQKLAGASNAEIGRREGLTRDWVRKELATAPARQIVVDLVNAEISAVEKTFHQSLLAIQAGLKAKAYVNFQGQAVCLGVDHYARLTAVKRLLELILAGRPHLKPAEETKREQGVTIQELEAMLKAEPVQ